ncbi:hypothetical protein PC116_g4764 [Phytophthora cactorum]|uniref:Uncharacterized protein n=1 Tax=Phytophthora cactorum TaxID=29920 RepID=A0A8T1DZF0_9STRA|nr:hypothetical protein PC112_g9044 [Phytophthora cactorum]KAG2828969.1 hypothetical protein PC111_g7945 [Phytophthora cactorum]KAG2858889.1 hypothetical protein PC113_g9437 [Phytophthora cactorum]KAG2908027.1 hypothetical protein PC114_g10628 [Phytophthora cactorum]KAG2922646.1 hypothetical protein PC115_g9186 [Phytophthora cactorum]
MTSKLWPSTPSLVESAANIILHLAMLPMALPLTAWRAGSGALRLFTQSCQERPFASWCWSISILIYYLLTNERLKPTHPQRHHSCFTHQIGAVEELTSMREVLD